MSKKGTKEYGMIWDDIGEDDFRSEESVDDREIGDFNKDSMVVFQANINYARQLARAEDSLKPVERRALYTFYLLGATPGHNVKSTKIIGSLMSIHNHSNTAAYASIINMAQYWKKNIPLVTGDCNLGVITAPDEYAADRYTELHLTKYANECFFEDFDMKAITTNGFLVGAEEPDTLPSKFPNILVNGNSGIGNGFASYMPPFNVYDIVDVCQKLIKNPNIPVEELVIAPDFPTGCDIVTNESEIEQYCTTGKGNVTVRGKIDIEDHGNTWVLAIKSLPYGTPFPSIKNKIMALGKSGVVAIKAVHEESQAYISSDGSTRKHLYFDVEIPKSLDPVKVMHILYKNCDLEKVLAMQSTVVVDDGKTTIKTMNMKELIMYWLNTRRIYKRSLFNHKINKTMSDIETNKAMIFLLEGTNLEKTISIIRGSTADTIVENLMSAYSKSGRLNSYQAKIIAAKPLSAFTSDAAKRYKAELIKLEEQLENLTSTAYSPKKIDDIIISELNELKKYGSPERKSQLITVENEKCFADTDHRILFTKNGHIKKLPLEVDSYHVKSPFGAFEQGDAVSMVATVNNTDGIILFNDRGRYTIIPVKDIENSVYNEYGDTVFNTTKLDGKIIAMYIIAGKEFASKKKSINVGKDAYVIALSKDGFMKKTLLSEYIYKDKKHLITSIKNAVATHTKSGDFICDTTVIPSKCMQDCEILVYSKRGDYVLLSNFDEIVELGKNASGTAVLVPASDDECAGFSLIYPSEESFAVIVTKNGYMKKIELEFLGKSKKRKDSSYISTINGDDEIVAIRGCGPKDSVTITTRNGEKTIAVKDIPTLARKSMPIKVISVSSNDEISDVHVNVKG